MPPKAPAELAATLGYQFKDPKLLELACIHKSYGNEHRSQERIDTRDNERLEFLGDAVLDLVVSQLLLERYPSYSEGDLSKLRASLVNEKSLARIARDISLGEHLLLGKGESNTGGHDKDSILASALEAVVAAIYLDGGIVAAETWIRQAFDERVSANQAPDALHDFKTRLQEVVQARYKTAPKYEVVQSSGPDHAKTFEIQLAIDGMVIATALGRSKKEAEQSAARIALEKLSVDEKAAEDPAR